MDSGLTIRATGRASQTSHAPTSTQQAVATELATSQTVTAAAGTTNVGIDSGQGHPSDTVRMPSVILDAQSREVIDCSAAPLREIARQAPEIVARRLKAYVRSGRQNVTQQDEHADIEV